VVFCGPGKFRPLLSTAGGLEGSTLEVIHSSATHDRKNEVPVPMVTFAHRFSPRSPLHAFGCDQNAQPGEKPCVLKPISRGRPEWFLGGGELDSRPPPQRRCTWVVSGNILIFTCAPRNAGGRYIPSKGAATLSNTLQLAGEKVCPLRSEVSPLALKTRSRRVQIGTSEKPAKTHPQANG